CIRNRALATIPGHPFVHIPYRSSRLTHILKDAFELSGTRLCRTVVLAHVAPTVEDTAHSVNTLNYAAPLKVSVPTCQAIDHDNPATWSHERMKEWVRSKIPSDVGPTLPEALVLPDEAGIQVARLTEAEFMERCLATGELTEKGAKKLYIALWRLIA